MTCALCKQPIVGGQKTVGVTHYACEVQLTDSWRSDLQRVTAQRDELLAALKGIVDDLKARWDMSDPRTNPGIRDNVQNAETAIAKAEAN